jgi:hypothetical protein
VLYFVAPLFIVRAFEHTLTGEEWGLLGAVTCFAFTDRKLARCVCNMATNNIADLANLCVASIRGIGLGGNANL